MLKKSIADLDEQSDKKFCLKQTFEDFKKQNSDKMVEVH